MPVEEQGEIDVIISQKTLDAEQKKLDKLKAIAAEKKRLVGGGPAGKELKLESREASKEAKKQAKVVSDIKKKLKDIEKKQRETDSKIKGFLGKLGRFSADPKAFVTETLFDIAKDNRWIPIIGTAVGLGLGIFKLIEKEFGDGGQFDLRKKVYDIVASIVGLKNLVDIESGEIFMSATTRLITIMPPETGNTESLRDGHVRFNQLTLGYI